MSDARDGRGRRGRARGDGASEPDRRPLPDEGHDAHAAVVARLSDYLDGELDRAGRLEVGAHLKGCGECSALLDDLRRVVSGAGALGERAPRHDLWPRIAAALTPRTAARERLDAPVEPRGRQPGRVTRRRLVMTVPQLAAAAALLVAFASSATWWAGGRIAPTDPGPGTGAAVAGSAAGGAMSPAVRAAAGAPEPMASELAALEAVLDSGREVLDPNTVLVLERNLAVIERAIDESRGALAIDPGSDFLANHLERAYERKLEYLRDVSRIVEVAG